MLGRSKGTSTGFYWFWGQPSCASVSDHCKDELILRLCFDYFLTICFVCLAVTFSEVFGRDKHARFSNLVKLNSRAGDG